jgi:hypothetical protein
MCTNQNTKSQCDQVSLNAGTVEVCSLVLKALFDNERVLKKKLKDLYSTIEIKYQGLSMCIDWTTKS